MPLGHAKGQAAAVSWSGRNLPMRIPLGFSVTVFAPKADFSVATDFCHPQAEKWFS
jgi:hypothetical protein